MTEFNVLGALALASIAGFAATQPSSARPTTIRANAQQAAACDRPARAGTLVGRDAAKPGPQG